MSNIDDDEALFEDIYGEDEVEKTEEVEEKKEEKTEAPAVPESVETTAPAVADIPAAPAAVATPATASGVPAAPATAPPPPAGMAMPTPPAGMPQMPGMPDFNNMQYNAPPPQPQPQLMAPSNMGRDSGKMFIGGLNWDTTEQGLVDYFSKYGEILDYTIMKDSSTGRSRGFGFLTFKDPTSVDAVVKTDHILDGKLIDPKRAIARDEQDKVGKIFVGGIDPLVNEKDFNDFFSQFGHIIDAQLMIDKDTGRSRGFGFITYDSPDAVDRVCVNKYVTLKGKSMEVKRAAPRGQHQQQQQLQQQQQQQMAAYNPYGQYGQMAAQYGQYSQANMTPEMVEYWQRMQQWYMYQQQQGGATEGDSEQPGQPLNPQQQGEADDKEEKPESDRRDNRDNGYGRNDYGRRDGPPRGPRRAPPSGPSRGGRGGSRGRGGYNRSRGYHPYGRGGSGGRR